MTVPWGELALFMIAVAMLALYGLTASGHFPIEYRTPKLRTGSGVIILRVTLVAAVLAAFIVLSVSGRTLPWFAITIGGGAVLLATPLMLRPFPDRFVNGPSGLVTFATGAAVAALVLLSFVSWA